MASSIHHSQARRRRGDKFVGLDIGVGVLALVGLLLANGPSGRALSPEVIRATAGQQQLASLCDIGCLLFVVRLQCRAH